MTEHKIKTIEDLTNLVNSKNVNRIIKALQSYLLSIAYFKKAEIPIEFKSFTWIDDNKREINFKIDSE